MTKFKVGDKVKTEYGIGKIVEIEEDDAPYLVYHDSWDKGHNGHNENGGQKYSGNHCLWFKGSNLELVEPTITSKININSSEITCCYGRFKTQIIVDDLSKDYGNIEKKEGNDMIESLNLVDLYASKQKEKIESETKEKIEELKGKNEIINKFNELAEKFKKDCDELYLSQFTEEYKNEILINKDFDDSDMPLIRDDGYIGNYVINLDFKPSEYYDLMNERNKEKNKINELVKTVKAHVSIAKTKEEVEEILTRYKILDKKGKLKI